MASEPTLPNIQPLSISESTPVSESNNPWSDSPVKEESTDEEHGLKTPDPSTLDSSVFAGLAAEVIDPQFRPPDTEKVLSEFDPLTDQQEQDARDAWASTEGHPPPPKDLTPGDPPKDSIPYTVTSPLNSLTAFARSFTALTRPSPKPAPSPTTLTSLVAQQAESNSLPDRSDQSFDFQTFLDQMKSRSAEPVAKYLKSSVHHLSLLSIRLLLPVSSTTLQSAHSQ